MALDIRSRQDSLRVSQAKMALDKAKTLRAAEKYLEMGKIPAAIKEYCKVVEIEPDDFTTLNVLGDLHVRVGNQPEAISCFRRIAEHYREQEFALKAIAMFKKIDRLKPNDVEIASSLADLYAQQDLLVEARAHYLLVVKAHEKSGDTEAGLEVLRKIADLDPQNTEVRLKLADSYLNAGMTVEAAASLTVAGHNLLIGGQLDEALEVFAHSLRIAPADYDTLSGLLAAHKARGTADEAAEIIAQSVTANADDAALLSLLAQAYLEAEDPDAAEKAIQRLAASDDSAHLMLVEVALLYARLDRLADAVRVISGTAEQMLAQKEESRLIDLLNELLTCDSDNVQVLRLLAQAYSANGERENLTGALDRLAEAAQTAGLEEDERYALAQLVHLLPEHQEYLARFQELGGSPEDVVIEESPQFESYVSEESAAEAEFIIESEETGEQIEVVAVNRRRESPNGMEIERGFAFEANADEIDAAVAELNFACADGEADPHSKHRAQELESVDFYIEQGYVDIAVDALELLESQFGKHPDIELRRARLAMAPNGNGSYPPPETAPAVKPESSAIPVAVEPSQPAAQMIDPGLAEIFEEYRASAEGEANGNGDYETHYNLGLAYQEMDLFEEALEEFQVAVALVSPNDGTPRHLQCCNLIGHCFLNQGVPQLAVTWFQKALSAPSASEDERQALRFDLAAAYEQAGELNRAMDLFTEVYGVNVAYRGVNERLRALQDRLGQ